MKTLATPLTAQPSPVSSRVGLSTRPSSSSPALSSSSGGLFAVTPELHRRCDLHLMRKTWHMFMGCMIAFVYWSGMSVSTSITILGSVLIWDLVMETLRLRNPAFNAKIMKVWRPFMRTCEVDRLSAIPHYLASAILAIAIFPKPVAVVAILYLACGDPIASLFGIAYGHKSFRFASGKSFVGTSAGVLTCALVTFLFLQTLPVSGSSLAILTVVGGLAGGMVELLPLDVDDNFSIPVVSGFVMWLSFMLLGV